MTTNTSKLDSSITELARQAEAAHAEAAHATSNFAETVAGQRCARIIDEQIKGGNAKKLIEKIDVVTENVYSTLPSGDYGRGDVRALILELANASLLPKLAHGDDYLDVMKARHRAHAHPSQSPGSLGDESPAEFLRRIARNINSEYEALLDDLPSIEAIIEYHDLWSVYDTEYLAGIQGGIVEGDDPKPYDEFVARWKLPWRTSKVLLRNVTEDDEADEEEGA